MRETYPDVLNLEVIEDDRIAVRPGAKADRGQVLVEADRLRPRRVAVRQRDDLHTSTNIHQPVRARSIGSGSATHLVLEPGRARPAAHDERVVRGDDRDDVDALRLEGVVLLEVRREVVHVAGGLAGSASARSRGGDGRGGLTVKAPGTEKSTTFFPFHASVVSLVAAGARDTGERGDLRGSIKATYEYHKRQRSPAQACTRCTGRCPRGRCRRP